MSSGQCLCGDVYCASCGSPGDVDFETACDWIYEFVLADMHESINIDWWSEELANRLGNYQEIADAILHVAKRQKNDDELRRLAEWKKKNEVRN